MSDKRPSLAQNWTRLAPRFLPFADAATEELPLGRLLRLALFQLSVGMAVTLLTGTMNRVMILELRVPATLVSLMIALPLLLAPFRALIGHRSDTHRSFLGWRRVPYLWFGTVMQFGGLGIMPFALLLLADGGGPYAVGHIASAAAFLLVGAGLHTTQTAGLALATDIAPAESRPRVVALLYVMLLIGMVMSALVFAWLLNDFSNTRLIQVIQGTALLTVVLNVIALWKQEVRDRSRTAHDRETIAFLDAWRSFTKTRHTRRLLLAVGLGTLAFSMQDILLEPYGGQVLGLSVSATTLLTALFATGTLIGFAIAAQRLSQGCDPYRYAAVGVLIGIVGFTFVVFAGPFVSRTLFQVGTGLIGMGSGLFAVCLLTVTMNVGKHVDSGMAMGAWGAVNASAAGIGLASGGALRDLFVWAGQAGWLGRPITDPAFGYGAVYHIEIAFLFATLIALGPLVGSARSAGGGSGKSSREFGLAEFPG